MTFYQLSEYLSKIEQTTSRNTITQILADVFKEATPCEIDKICHLLLGRIAPSYTGVEFNFAERMMIRAIAQAYSIKPERVGRMYKDKGDLGDVAQELANSKHEIRNSKLTVEEVFERLKKLATEAGVGSQKGKLTVVVELLRAIDPLSAKYIARIPTGRLRLGFSDMTILDALSVAKVGDKSARKVLETAYNVTVDIGKVAQEAKTRSLHKLERTHAVAGIPVRCSLAERLDSAGKIIEKVGPKVAVEPKFDGFRLAIHVWGKGKDRQVRLFSRNQENVTQMFPEISSAALRLSVGSAIFDGEAIGYNPKTGKFYPFQETVQRKRKYGIEEAARNIPLKVFVFDVLYLDGKTLMDKPFSERRRVLERVLKRTQDGIVLTEQWVVDNAEEFKKTAAGYLGEGLEGAMAKKLDVAYQAGGRGFHWVKYKKHTEGSAVSDTIDCVLMGAYRGRGRRATFGVGSFLLGVRDREKYYTVSNLGTGLSDERFREIYKVVKSLEVGKQPKEYVVDKTVAPDIWTRPKVVLEILADEITLSPRHTAGRDTDTDKQSLKRKRYKQSLFLANARNKQRLPLRGKGYSLRFPRLVKIRDDKNPEQATTVGELRKLYRMQGKS